MPEVRDLEQAKVILTSWQSQDKIVTYCRHCGTGAGMLPMAEIQQTSSGFKITLFWVCAGCGERKGA